MSSDKNRAAPRRSLEKVSVIDVAMMEPFVPVATQAYLVDASSSGFLLEIHRNDITNKDLRANLTLESMLGKPLMLEIELMGLEVYGTVIRTKMVGKGTYELAIDFSDEAPEYWRECLVDMLPSGDEADY